jgi:hypothetical protein
MNEIELRYDVTKRDLAKGRNLLIGAWMAPFVLSAVPAGLFFLLMFIFGTTPPVAVIFFFLAVVTGIVGLAAGLGLSGYFAYRRSEWNKEMRERIAADGIRAEEIEWFKNELKSNEKRSLAEISARDLLLADAYRETLATRLTATRIIKSSKRELQLMQRRLNKLKTLKTDSSAEFQETLGRDIAKIDSIHNDSKVMLAEAETRLQMIEAASVRGSALADSELVLKKLSARAAELPLALQEAKMADEIRAELEKEPLE